MDSTPQSMIDHLVEGGYSSCSLGLERVDMDGRSAPATASAFYEQEPGALVGLLQQVAEFSNLDGWIEHPEWQGDTDLNMILPYLDTQRQMLHWWRAPDSCYVVIATGLRAVRAIEIVHEVVAGIETDIDRQQRIIEEG